MPREALNDDKRKSVCLAYSLAVSEMSESFSFHGRSDRIESGPLSESPGIEGT